MRRLRRSLNSGRADVGNPSYRGAPALGSAVDASARDSRNAEAASLIAKYTITSAAAGSSHDHPNATFTARPTSTATVRGAGGRYTSDNRFANISNKIVIRNKE